MDANTITTIVGFAGIISTLALGFFASFRQANTTNSRLDSMDKRIDSMDKRIDSMDNRLDSMDNRLDRLTEIVSDNRDNLMLIRGHLNIGITSSRLTPPTSPASANPEQPEPTTEQLAEAPMAS